MKPKTKGHSAARKLPSPPKCPSLVFRGGEKWHSIFHMSLNFQSHQNRIKLHFFNFSPFLGWAWDLREGLSGETVKQMGETRLFG